MSAIDEIWLENRRGAQTVGIAEAAPRVSWRHGYADPSAFEMAFERYDGTVETSQSASATLARWPFAPLAPRDGGWLRIREATAPEWSEPLQVEAGLGSEWAANFVSPSAKADARLRPAYLMRASFELPVPAGEIARARIYATAHGVYELEVNGVTPSDDRLAPGWTSYRHRLRYQTHDIGSALREGANTVGVWLADGWYRGHIGFDGGVWDFFGEDLSILLQVELTTRDGAVHRVDLEDAWRWHRSAITEVGLYEGETFDARSHPEGWSSPEFDSTGWASPTVFRRGQFSAVIEPPTGPPVRAITTLAPVDVEHLPDGRWRLDFGQNISGVLRIRPRGAAGQVIRLHHAEVLEGEALGTRPLRGAFSVDTYVCRGDGIEEWEPRFTIHGFRYAEIENWPGRLDRGDVEAVVTHTDMVRTGWFASSHPGLNQLHSNVVWSMRDNFVDLPTDCPQRDERMGWTGDIQVFAPTALSLYAAHGTLTGWLQDLAAEQWPDGHVPQFVPWVECGFPNFPTAAWGDAAVIVPWSLYEHDGDARVLERQYPSMRAWVELVHTLTGGSGLWNTGFQLGDWLDPAAPPESPGDSHTDRYLVATAYHVKTARLLARTAHVLGKNSDALRYEQMAAHATSAFQAEYLSASGRVVSDTPTSIAVALVFDLFPDAASAQHAGARLLELVAASGYRITTGFVGTPIICDALVAAGDPDAAYALLLQEDLPSWLYPVTMGATTIWERWDSMLPDGTINPGDMTSFNHYALGAVADFLHRRVAGLAADGVGWKHLRFAPLPGGGLTYAEARHDSPAGVAAARWTRSDDSLTFTATVPPGATGTVQLPGAPAHEIGPGEHRFTVAFRPAHEDPPVSGRQLAAPDRSKS